MDQAERLRRIDEVNHASNDEVGVLLTGKEIIDLPAHSHNCHQLTLTLSGTLHVIVDNTDHFIPEGHICIIPAGLTHTLSTRNKQISLEIIYYKTDCDYEDLRIYNSNAFLLGNLRFLSEGKKRIHRTEDAELYQFTLSFLQLLPMLAQAISLPLKGFLWPRDERLCEVLSYIAEYAPNELRLETVASHFGFTDRSLSRLFTRHGLSFSNFHNYQRIIRAVELFADKDISIQEVAYQVGYNSPNSFNRVFKKMTGTSPRHFIESQKRNYTLQE